MSKFTLIKYLKYLLKSKNKHGVHSPFVYELITKVFNDNTTKNKYKKIGQTNQANDNSNSKKYLKLLLRLTKHFQPKSLLKIGASDCPKTELLKKTNPNTFFYSHEIANDKAVSLETTIPKSVNKIDFVLIKSNENLRTYFEYCAKYTHNNSVMIIDNIHQNEKIEIIWRQILEHNSVRVSIDLFYIGIVFFRKEQAKENFIVRF